MWPWLWIIISLLDSSFAFGEKPEGAPAPSATPDAPVATPVSPSPSPSPSASASAVQTEADLLWQRGRKAFEKGEYRSAISSLSRLVERTPSHGSALDAHRLLGISHLKLGNTKEAVAPLQHFIEAKGNTLEAARTRLDLGQAYLGLGKFNEAYLTSMEVTQTAKKAAGSPPPELHVAALLLKTESLIGLGRHGRAERTLRSAKKDLTQIRGGSGDEDSLQNRAKAEWLDLALVLHGCDRYPTEKKMSEEQAIDQIQKKGACLQEATLALNKVLQQNVVTWADRAVARYSSSIQDYKTTCNEPPAPAGPRTKTEQERYQAELKQALQRECQKKIKQLLELTESWKEQLPGGMVAQAKKIRESLL